MQIRVCTCMHPLSLIKIYTVHSLFTQAFQKILSTCVYAGKTEQVNRLIWNYNVKSCHNEPLFRGWAYNISRSTSKSTLWTLRKVSTRISLSMPRRLMRTYYASCGCSVSGITTLYIYPSKTECVGLISLRGQRRLIWSIHYADVYRRSCPRRLIRPTHSV